jgi:hypothetical protein
MAEARRKGWKPPATIQELEARTMREGLAIVRKKLEAARRPKSLAAPAAATVAGAKPFTFTPATVAAFKRGLKAAILPALIQGAKARPKAPAPPAAPPSSVRRAYQKPGTRTKCIFCGHGLFGS